MNAIDSPETNGYIRDFDDSTIFNWTVSDFDMTDWPCILDFNDVFDSCAGKYPISLEIDSLKPK